MTFLCFKRGIFTEVLRLRLLFLLFLLLLILVPLLRNRPRSCKEKVNKIAFSYGLEVRKSWHFFKFDKSKVVQWYIKTKVASGYTAVSDSWRGSVTWSVRPGNPEGSQG